MTINQAAGQADPTNSSPDQFTVVFSEPVTGFTGDRRELRRQPPAATLVGDVTGSGADLHVRSPG